MDLKSIGVTRVSSNLTAVDILRGVLVVHGPPRFASDTYIA